MEGCVHGDATERRSAYAKASAYAEAMADKLADKYEIGGEGVARRELSRKLEVTICDLKFV